MSIHWLQLRLNSWVNERSRTYATFTWSGQETSGWHSSNICVKAGHYCPPRTESAFLCLTTAPHTAMPNLAPLNPIRLPMKNPTSTFTQLWNKIVVVKFFGCSLASNSETSGSLGLQSYTNPGDLTNLELGKWKRTGRCLAPGYFKSHFSYYLHAPSVLTSLSTPLRLSSKNSDLSTALPSFHKSVGSYVPAHTTPFIATSDSDARLRQLY